MKNLVIIGASGFGREVAWLVERINRKEKQWNLLGFLDDNVDLQKRTINGYPVIGTINDAAYVDAYYVCAIGSSKIRRKIIERIENIVINPRFATLIDPSVEISEFVEIGEGTIICAHTIITVNIQIGKNVIVNLDCTIGHDAEIRDFVTLYPSVNVSGMAQIGHTSEIGTATQIIQGKTIGSNSVIGAGSVVIHDIPDNCTAVGCPAKPIKFFC